MHKNITQNFDAKLAIARINVTAIANGMKQGFDVARICIAESLRHLILRTRSAVTHVCQMIFGGTDLEQSSRFEYGRNTDCCYSPGSKPMEASLWRSQSPKQPGGSLSPVQSLVTT